MGPVLLQHGPIPPVTESIEQCLRRLMLWYVVIMPGASLEAAPLKPETKARFTCDHQPTKKQT